MPYFVFSPVTWAVLLFPLMLMSWRRLTRVWRVAGILCGAVLLLLCMPLGANMLERGLEALVPGESRCPSQALGPVVLLSGGFDREPRNREDYGSFTLETWKRAREAVDLWHAHGSGELWIAGGGPYAFKESALLARLARDWDVPADALRIEADSTTTWESAFALGERPRKDVRLVTSPAHQARALLAFRAAGFEPCVQAVTSDVVPFGGPGYLLPQSSAIEKSENAIYELVGLVYYGVRERRAR